MLFFMNEIEKRRRDLLTQTRNLYHEKYVPPAIHPRFQTTYHSLYGRNENVKSNYLWLRFLLAVSLFALVFLVYQKEVSIGNINYENIIASIKDNLFGESFPLLIKRLKFF